MTCAVRSLLDEVFPNLWVGERGPSDRPESSPDLTPLHFSLWGFLEDEMYWTCVSNLTQLKRKNTTEIRNISQEILNNRWINLEN